MTHHLPFQPYITCGMMQGVLTIPADGTLTLGSSAFFPVTDFGKFLNDWFAGGPLTITQATQVSSTTSPCQVVIAGTTSLPPALVAAGAAVTSADVVATFTLGSLGQAVAVVLQYSLIGATAAAGDWTPSDSFAFLPPTANPLVAPGAAQSSVFGTLSLSNAFLIVGNVSSTLNGVSVPGGLFFMADAATTGPLALLAWQKPSIKLSGPITFTSRKFPALERPAFPWNQDTPPQGILLSGALRVPGIGAQAAAHLGVTSDAFHLYTPTDAVWLQENPTYTPVMGIRAQLSIPSAGLTSVVMTTPVIPGCREYLLDAEFTPALTIADLASLFDLTGATSTHSLTRLFPEELQTAVQAVADMGLETLTISFQPAGNLHVVGYTFFMLTMNLPDWEVVENYLTVSGLGSRWYVSLPYGGSPGFSMSLLGTLTIAGVELDVEVDPYPDFTIQAEAKDLTLPLQTLVSTYFTGVTPPADLTVNELYLMAEPGNGDYTVGAKVSGWSLTVGTQTLSVSNAQVQFSAAGGAPQSGVLSGALNFGANNVVEVGWTFPGTFSLAGEFPYANTLQILRYFVNPLPAYVPAVLDCTLTSTSVLIEAQTGGGYLFQAGTHVEGMGSMAIQVQTVAGATGVAVGIAVDGAQFASLARKLEVERLTSGFSITSVVLIVSTFASPTFAFPQMSVFDNRTIKAKEIKVPAGGVVAGLNLYGSMSLGTSGEMGMIAAFLDITRPVDVTLQVSVPPSASSSLQVSATAKVPGGTLAATFGTVITAGTPAVFLTGTYTTTIAQQQLSFPVTAAFMAQGAFLSGSLAGSLTVEKMTISSLALQAGINRQGGASLGVSGVVTLQGGGQVALAVVFNPRDAAQSLIAGSLSGGTFWGLVQSIAGPTTAPAALQETLEAIGLAPTLSFTAASSLADDLGRLDAAAISTAFRRSSSGRATLPSSSTELLIVPAPGKTWYLTDLTTMAVYTLVAGTGGVTVTRGPQLYFAPSDVTMGTRTFPRGFSVSGLLELPGVSLNVSLTVSSGEGISADVTLSPIDFYHGTLRITGSGGVGGPRFSMTTFGPYPHLELSGQVSVLGVVGTDVKITLNPGFGMLEFVFGGSLGEVSFGVDGYIWSDEWWIAARISVAFTEDTKVTPATGSAGGWQFGVVLGSVEATMSVWLEAARGIITPSIQGYAIMGGERFDLPKTSITLEQAELSQAVRTIKTVLYAAIALAINDAVGWLKLLAAGILTLRSLFGEDAAQLSASEQAVIVGQTLKGFYGKSAKSIANDVTSIMGYGVVRVAYALKGAGESKLTAAATMLGMNKWTQTQILAGVNTAYG